MPKYSGDIESVVTRMVLLEARVRNLGVALVAVVALSVTAVVLVGLVQSAAEAQSGRTIEAERFLLKDARGRLQGDLRAGERGPRLELLDSNGTHRVTLVAETTGSSVTLFDAAERRRVTISVTDRPVFTIYDANGNVMFSMP